MNRNYTLLREDRLRSVYLSPDGNVTAKGKRASRDCPLTTEERRAYVKKGALAAVILIRERTNATLNEAYRLLKEARGTVRIR